MSTIQVDDDIGTVLYYEDTGLPADSPDDYLTIVLVHGMIIHGDFCQRPTEVLRTIGSHSNIVSQYQCVETFNV